MKHKLWKVLFFSVVIILMVACKNQDCLVRPEFDAVQITYEDNSTQTVNQFLGPDIIEAKETTDSTLMDKVWEIYTELVPNNSNRPLGLPRYRVSYLKNGVVVMEWRISEEGIVSGDRWGLGNKALKDVSAFKDIETVWERIQK